MNQDKYFNGRHTVRSYSEKILDNALLCRMIEAASHAPNTGNMQWYSVIVTRDEEQKKRLSPAHFNQPTVMSAQAVLTFCLDLNRFEHWCRMNRATPGFENFQSFVAAIIDTSLFAQQFVTIAEMNGLGTCYLGTTTYNAPQIAEALGLPDRVVPVTTVTVGYPSPDAADAPTWRLPLQAIMHDEKYAEASDADIAEWYAPIEAESQHFVDENNLETLAQVFTQVRYPQESAEHFSKVYKELLASNRLM